MNPQQLEQLLEFVRNEVVPLILAQAAPGGEKVMTTRTQEQYPELDLFARD